MEQINRKCQVVLLVTEEKSELYYHNPTEVLRFDKKYSNLKGVNEFMNLYILSDEEIKEGDLKYCFNTDQITSATLVKNGICKDCRKLIATTNFNLHYKTLKIYKINQDFIKKYISEYNKGNIIKEVMVECEAFNWHYENNSPDEGCFDYKPKLKKDGSVIISIVKDRFTAKDLINAFTAGARWKSDIKNAPCFQEWFDKQRF